MDYKKLDNMAKVEGREALRERLATIFKQVEAAKKRNKSEEAPDGLKKGIRRTRYMLDQLVSGVEDEKQITTFGYGGLTPTLRSPAFILE